ncbi:histidine kinase dimerization/phosphoacceptor domain -containing protein [Winogradskyella luteola]|uniref:histidine kinase n=1 Tax=Winogradskyella luteola TaxID=2828330 RepID=A0A9X1F9C9_9FLAO|nr:histidine kinase dimerization/phosphoacceptor domain -containing protein [Winogradskyella luteola]MBV7269727.1 hypothetical protein [Winogradskyella luteola]
MILIRFFFIIVITSGLVFSQEPSNAYIDSVIVNSENYKNINKLFRKISQLSSDKAIAKFEYIDATYKKNDTLKLNLYSHYSSVLLRYGKNNKALELNSKGLQLAKKYKSPHFLFEYYQMRANIYDDKAIIDSTMVYINKAEAIVNANKDELGAKMTRIYQQRAILEQKLGNAEKEDQYIEKIADVVAAYPEHNMAFDLAMVVYHFKTRKDYVKHAYYSQKLKAYYLKRDGIATPKSHESITSMLKMDNTNKQIKELKSILNSNDSLNYAFLSPQTANILGAKLYDIGNYKDAIYYINKSLKYNTNGLSPYSKVMSYDNLYRIYYDTKDFEKAIDVLNKKIDIQNTIRQKETLDKITVLEVEFESKKKSSEIKLLKAENRNKKQQKQLYLILALCGLIVASMFAFFALKNRKQKRILAKQKRELEITVEQKNVLFKEIHHRVKNSLQMVSSLLFLQGQNIIDKQAKSALKNAQNRVRSLGLIHQKLYGKNHIDGV